VRILDGRKDHIAKKVAYLPQGQVIHWPLSVKRLVSLGRIPHHWPWEQLGPEDEKAIAQAMADTDVAHLQDRLWTIWPAVNGTLCFSPRLRDTAGQMVHKTILQSATSVSAMA